MQIDIEKMRKDLRIMVGKCGFIEVVSELKRIHEEDQKKPEAKKFIENEKYSCRSICDSDCIFGFEVIKRTEKRLTLDSGKTVGILKDENGNEMAYPLGKYSMCPILRA